MPVPIPLPAASRLRDVEPAARRGALHDAIRERVRSATIEVSVKHAAEVDRYREWLAAGQPLYLTWLHGFPFSHTASVAARLSRAGFRPIPHITTRRLTSAAAARELLARLAGEAGVDEALVIAGDVDRPAGAYDSAASLIESGLLQAHGIRRVGIAGYPEGHPRIAPGALEDALLAKQALCRAAGLQACIVTQFCFDAGPILSWLGRLRAAGIELPVRVGLAGPARIRTLLNFGMRCGIGNSLRALRKHGVSLTRLAAQKGPEEVVGRLARAGLEDAPGAPFSLHFFSLGGVERSARWMARVAAGEFELDPVSLEMSSPD